MSEIREYDARLDSDHIHTRQQAEIEALRTALVASNSDSSGEYSRLRTELKCAQDTADGLRRNMFAFKRERDEAEETIARLRVENQIRAQEYAALLGLWKEAQERLEKAELALFALFSLCGSMQFEPDAGQPHPVKDGIYDKIMAQARNHLAQYDSHAEQKETT